MLQWSHCSTVRYNKRDHIMQGQHVMARKKSYWFLIRCIVHCTSTVRNVKATNSVWCILANTRPHLASSPGSFPLSMCNSSTRKSLHGYEARPHQLHWTDWETWTVVQWLDLRITATKEKHLYTALLFVFMEIISMHHVSLMYVWDWTEGAPSYTSTCWKS